MRQRAEPAFAGFALVFFLFHQGPSTFLEPRGEAAVDVLTPFFVIGASALVLIALRAPRAAIVLAVVAGTLYVHGHGVHLAANSIHNDGVDNDVVYFWDERFSHIEAVLGWFGLVASFCVAEAAGRVGARDDGARVAGPRRRAARLDLLHQHGRRPDVVAGARGDRRFAVWAVRAPRPLLRAAAAAFLIGAALIGVWAVMQGGVPEFSEV